MPSDATPVCAIAQEPIADDDRAIWIQLMARIALARALEDIRAEDTRREPEKPNRNIPKGMRDG